VKIRTLILLAFMIVLFTGCKSKEKTIWLVPPATDYTGGFADSGTYLDTLYVATTGSMTGDGTPGNPYNTLLSALLESQPGDIIRLLPGTYGGGGYVTNLKGTIYNPIMIAGDPAGGTVISGGSGNGFQFSDPAYVVVQDLTIENAPYNGINIDDGGTYSTPAHHIVLRRLTIRNIGTGGNQDGLKLSGVDWFHIENCEISYCGGGLSGSLIDMVGCHHGVIRANYLHNGSGNAVQAKGGTENILIWQNRFVEAGERALNLGGSTDSDYFRPLGANYEARNLRAIANIFIDCKAPVSFVGCDGALAANNTIYLPQTWVARILQESVTGYIPCRYGRFINNIIVFNEADLSTFVNVGPDTAPETFTFANNLWYCLDNPGFIGPMLPVTETGGLYQQNPLHTLPGSGDFHIGSGSPAIDAGQFAGEVPADYDGVKYQNPPSVGAFEGP